MKNPLLARALVLAAVALGILVPIALIEGKISERRERATAVVAGFAGETAHAQTLAGPLLAITCEQTVTQEREIKRAGKAETIAEKKVVACPTLYVPPRTLRVKGDMPVETRHRGIYPIRLYRATLELAGEFDWPAPPAGKAGETMVYREAHVVIAVSDPRGLKEVSSSFGPVTQSRGSTHLLGPFAVRQELGAHASRAPATVVPFAYRIELIGTSSLHVAPVGDESDIRIASDWPHPSFSGGWSPDERSIGSGGFHARWKTTHLATGGAGTWQTAAGAGKMTQPASGAGVLLFDPVNVYALSYRATQYSFLFVLFTFGALALAEATAGVRLHPVQYALVGSALAVFFLLLIALSEHIDFPTAYAAAATACVALLTFYLRHPLATWARTLRFLVFFSGLYGALYVVLQSEDHALLMGSLMVFAVLAVAMIATRRLDWAAMAARVRAPAAAEG